MDLEKEFPYRAPNMYDEVIVGNSKDGQAVYKHDCYNLPFCESEEQTAPFLSCVKGANNGYRCERVDKMILFQLGKINQRLARLEELASKSVGNQAEN